MVATTRIAISDLGQQKKYETDLGGRLTPNHTVQQAIEHYLDRMQIHDNGLRWTAFSRGVRLDNKQQLSDVPDTDSRWTVMPEVSAGAC